MNLPVTIEVDSISHIANSKASTAFDINLRFRSADIDLDEMTEIALHETIAEISLRRDKKFPSNPAVRATRASDKNDLIIRRGQLLRELLSEISKQGEKKLSIALHCPCAESYIRGAEWVRAELIGRRLSLKISFINETCGVWFEPASWMMLEDVDLREKLVAGTRSSGNFAGCDRSIVESRAKDMAGLAQMVNPQFEAELDNAIKQSLPWVTWHLGDQQHELDKLAMVLLSFSLMKTRSNGLFFDCLTRGFPHFLSADILEDETTGQSEKKTAAGKQNSQLLFADGAEWPKAQRYEGWAHIETAGTELDRDSYKNLLYHRALSRAMWEMVRNPTDKSPEYRKRIINFYASNESETSTTIDVAREILLQNSNDHYQNLRDENEIRINQIVNQWSESSESVKRLYDRDKSENLNRLYADYTDVCGEIAKISDEWGNFSRSSTEALFKDIIEIAEKKIRAIKQNEWQKQEKELQQHQVHDSDSGSLPVPDGDDHEPQGAVAPPDTESDETAAIWNSELKKQDLVSYLKLIKRYKILPVEKLVDWIFEACEQERKKPWIRKVFSQPSVNLSELKYVSDLMLNHPEKHAKVDQSNIKLLLDGGSRRSIHPFWAGVISLLFEKKVLDLENIKQLSDELDSQFRGIRETIYKLINLNTDSMKRGKMDFVEQTLRRVHQSHVFSETVAAIEKYPINHPDISRSILSFTPLGSDGGKTVWEFVWVDRFLQSVYGSRSPDEKYKAGDVHGALHKLASQFAHTVPGSVVSSRRFAEQYLYTTGGYANEADPTQTDFSLESLCADFIQYANLTSRPVPECLIVWCFRYAAALIGSNSEPPWSECENFSTSKQEGSVLLEDDLSDTKRLVDKVNLLSGRRNSNARVRYIFVSYSHHDGEGILEQLRLRIDEYNRKFRQESGVESDAQAREIKLLIDKDLRSGEVWTNNLANYIAISHMVLFVVSETSLLQHVWRDCFIKDFEVPLTERRVLAASNATDAQPKVIFCHANNVKFDQAQWSNVYGDMLVDDSRQRVHVSDNQNEAILKDRDLDELFSLPVQANLELE